MYDYKLSECSKRDVTDWARESVVISLKDKGTQRLWNITVHILLVYFIMFISRFEKYTYFILNSLYFIVKLTYVTNHL